MKSILNKIFFVITIFLLPFLTFVYENIKLIDFNIITNLIIINFISLILIFLISFIFAKFFKNDNFFNYLIFFLLSYNTLFYFEIIKNFFLDYTSKAFYISILLILGIFFIIYKKFKVKIISNFIRIYFFLSNAILLILITFTTIDKSDYNRNDYPNSNIFNDKKIFNNSHLKPNIYLIIMDGMTSLKYANDFLNIDYNSHKNFLLKNNFKYYDSYSNYNTTYLSLAAIMELNYVAKPNDNKYLDRKEFWPLILSRQEKKPKLIEILEDNGFTFKWFGNITSSCKNYSYNKNFCPEGELSSTYYVFNNFYSNTPIIIILRKFFPEIMLNYYGDKIDAISNFINSKKIHKNSFTLIHHLSPHPPYIYNSDCSAKKKLESSITTLNSSGYKDAYLCSLKKIEELIEYLNQFDANAHVLISADHGWNIDESKSKNRIDKIREKAQIYNSIRVNEECKKYEPKDFDTINSVRYLVGCSLNLKPIFLESEILYGFQEEDKENFGKIYRLK